jgi:hypothetical protein
LLHAEFQGRQVERPEDRQQIEHLGGRQPRLILDRFRVRSSRRRSRCESRRRKGGKRHQGVWSEENLLSPSTGLGERSRGREALHQGTPVKGAGQILRTYRGRRAWRFHRDFRNGLSGDGKGPAATGSKFPSGGEGRAGISPWSIRTRVRGVAPDRRSTAGTRFRSRRAGIPGCRGGRTRCLRVPVVVGMGGEAPWCVGFRSALFARVCPWGIGSAAAMVNEDRVRHRPGVAGVGGGGL